MERPLVIIDDAVPFIEGVLEPWFEVEYMPGSSMDAGAVRSASALVVRTRTKCNASLLEGSAVEFIGTATIGTDHIDTDWCSKNGITVANAPGCNSGAVCQYVFSALDSLGLEKCTLGVIGVGHVGSKVAREGRRRGFTVLENDPPRGLPLSIDELLADSDVVTVHIPMQGNEGFVDRSFIMKMKEGASLIIASRGEVAVEEDIIDCRGHLGRLVVDVWRNEPSINRRLLDVADIATPHIAGYSIQGKINGTVAVVRAIARKYSIPELLDFTPDVELPERCRYDIMKDDRALRSNPSAFEILRNNYELRVE